MTKIIVASRGIVNRVTKRLSDYWKNNIGHIGNSKPFQDVAAVDVPCYNFEAMFLRSVSEARILLATRKVDI